MKTAKKITAAILIAVLSLAVIVSSAYIISEADHDCTGADCEICIRVALCENTVKGISLAVISFAAFRHLNFCIASAVIPAKSRVSFCNPVFLKDELLC